MDGPLLYSSSEPRKRNAVRNHCCFFPTAEILLEISPLSLSYSLSLSVRSALGVGREDMFGIPEKERKREGGGRWSKSETDKAYRSSPKWPSGERERTSKSGG